MHGVARLALHPVIPNIQTSWVKMSQYGAALCPRAGANDLGGTLMDQSISRAADSCNGQQMTPRRMQQIPEALGRLPRQRTTLYADVPPERRHPARDNYERSGRLSKPSWLA